ncbi:hypothetical protein KC19_4G248800 [Ceratodon purpureus]|uniref:Uncharacterized protein n=1 Tax=Ceratodon purpureus TaxID=3225 RepID=A0A8T0ICC9_CERPU|nr:hypothetical protein KC19_4G248800 [Ceratodon purpureus]
MFGTASFATEELATQESEPPKSWMCTRSSEHGSAGHLRDSWATMLERLLAKGTLNQVTQVSLAVVVLLGVVFAPVSPPSSSRRSADLLEFAAQSSHSRSIHSITLPPPPACKGPTSVR